MRRSSTTGIAFRISVAIIIFGGKVNKIAIKRQLIKQKFKAFTLTVRPYTCLFLRLLTTSLGDFVTPLRHNKKRGGGLHLPPKEI